MLAPSFRSMFSSTWESITVEYTCLLYTSSTYDKSIITDELLNAPSDLPEVTQENLTSEWKGAGMSARKDGRNLQQDFKEADLAFLADNGFNFTRVFFGFTSLRYPDFPEDITQINETELLELDQLIAWGIEYGVHIQLSMIDTPGDLESMDLSEEEWENVRAYWEMLARRYAGIPSRYLTFDLANELQPGEEDLENAAAQDVYKRQGCTHACKYCYASFMKRFTNHPEPWGEFLDVKYWPEIKKPEKYAGKEPVSYTHLPWMIELVTASEIAVRISSSS